MRGISCGDIHEDVTRTRNSAAPADSHSVNLNGRMVLMTSSPTPRTVLQTLAVPEGPCNALPLYLDAAGAVSTDFTAELVDRRERENRRPAQAGWEVQ